MLRNLQFDFGDMALAIVVWLCTLPLIGFIAIPLLGRGSAILIAIGLFFLIMAVCWGICGVKAYQSMRHDQE